MLYTIKGHLIEARGMHVSRILRVYAEENMSGSKGCMHVPCRNHDSKSQAGSI